MTASPDTRTAWAIGKFELGIGYRTISARAAFAASSKAASTSMLCFIFAPPRFIVLWPDALDVVGRDGVLILVAEMGSHIIDDGGNLVVVHHDADRRHRPLSPDNDVNRIPAGLEIAVLCERRICSRADRAFAVRHVATLAGACEQFFAGRFRKAEARAQRGQWARTRFFVRMRAARRQ